MPHFGARQSLLCCVSRAVCPVGPDGEILVSWQTTFVVFPLWMPVLYFHQNGDGQVQKMQSLTTPWEAGKTRLNTMHFKQWQVYLCPTSTWLYLNPDDVLSQKTVAADKVDKNQCVHKVCSAWCSLARAGFHKLPPTPLRRLQKELPPDTVEWLGLKHTNRTQRSSHSCHCHCISSVFALEADC